MKKILATVLAALSVAVCAGALAACGDNDDGGEKKQYAVYHLNGGYIGDPEDTEDYRQYLHEDTAGSFKPLKAKRETWVFENWYFNEELTEAYSEQRFEELRARQDEVDLYAKWIDEITITKENFAEFFKVSSRWNGGATIGFAGINYSISPIMAIDSLISTASFEVEITPILTNNNSVVWSDKKFIETLTSETNYSCDRVIRLGSSAAGIPLWKDARL